MTDDDDGDRATLGEKLKDQIQGVEKRKVIPLLLSQELLLSWDQEREAIRGDL